MALSLEDRKSMKQQIESDLRSKIQANEGALQKQQDRVEQFESERVRIQQVVNLRRMTNDELFKQATELERYNKRYQKLTSSNDNTLSVRRCRLKLALAWNNRASCFCRTYGFCVIS